MENPGLPPLPDISGMKRQLLEGEIEEEEFFCLVMSTLGEHRTYRHLPHLIHSLTHTQPGLYGRIMDIHREYFLQVMAEAMESSPLSCDECVRMGEERRKLFI